MSPQRNGHADITIGAHFTPNSAYGLRRSFMFTNKVSMTDNPLRFSQISDKALPVDIGRLNVLPLPRPISFFQNEMQD